MTITYKDEAGIAGMRVACRLASEVLDFDAAHPAGRHHARDRPPGLRVHEDPGLDLGHAGLPAAGLPA
jgi:hypothetical protein